jgi:hypothetical protein
MYFGPIACTGKLGQILGEFVFLGFHLLICTLGQVVILASYMY